MTRAQPPLEFIPPSLNPLVLRGCQTILPFWIHGQTNITDIEATRVEVLAELFQQFQQGKNRFLMAFRHPSVNDPLCLGYLLWNLLPKIAKKQGIPLQYPTHAHFMYDRGIPLWAGEWSGWLFSRLGSTPIQRGKTDLMGLRAARRLFAESNFPMAAAPEGATNGHNEIVSPLEPGLSQLCFWCVEDLKKAKRSEEVFLLPIGLQYHYVTPPWQQVEQLLTQLEKDSGLNPEVSASNDLNEPIIYQRLYQLGEHILSLMENFYREFYQKNLPQVAELKGETKNDVFATRLQNLFNVALQVAEQYFNLVPKGNLVDRCRRLEQAGWDCIYREELKPTRTLSSVELGLADRIAEEASLRMWHMRIVEGLVAVTGYYVKNKPTVERFAETTLLLGNLVSKIKGENASFIPKLGKQRVQMTIGEPISVSARWEDYKANRRQTVANLTQDLQSSLEKMIIN